jgi:hypothetical protein
MKSDGVFTIKNFSNFTSTPMKPNFSGLFAVCTLVFGSTLVAQVADPNLTEPGAQLPVGNAPNDTRATTVDPPAIVERGPHEQRWQVVRHVTEGGSTVSRTNFFVEVQSGLNRW